MLADLIERYVTAQLFVSFHVIVVVIHVVLLGVAGLIYLERKISAYIHDRIGPNRVGPLGLLQPIADGLKFFVKEDFSPRGVDKG
ncbi:MAG: NADH-quinone oxidoreductase subunit H, partial [Phycisphaerales bacterium]